MNKMRYGAILYRVGYKLNDWTALTFFRHPQTNVAMVVVQCKCGKICMKEMQQLTGKNASKKCRDCPRYRGGVGATPEYKAWRAARDRCHNPKAKAYQGYGGRGIEMCERWRSSFAYFLADMGKRPSKEHSLDRIDNDRGYEPGNCRWATRADQARNRRSTKTITVNGETACVAEWERRLGFSHHGIANRIKRGWSPEDAVTTPINQPTRSY